MYLSMLQFQCVSKLCRKTTNYCGRSCRNPSKFLKKNPQITVFVPVKAFSFKAFKKIPIRVKSFAFEGTKTARDYRHFCLFLRKVTVPYRDEMMSSDSSLAKNIFKKIHI